MSQLDLLPSGLPSDVIVACALCGRPIVAQHHEAGYVESEYRGVRGECFKCSRPRKKETR